MKPEVIRTKSLARTASRFIADSANEAIDAHGFFCLSLSGCEGPRAVYQALALMDCAWTKWIITFGDELCLPPDDARTNYRIASECFLMVTTPGEVLRMKGELMPQEGAEEYNSAIHYLAVRFRQERLAHDLVLLGLGEDGHTASLFPETPALRETSRDVVCNFVPKLDAWRLTVTFPLINAAHRVAFLVNDPRHEPLVEAILHGDSSLPAGRVQPSSGELIWFIAS